MQRFSEGKEEGEEEEQEEEGRDLFGGLGAGVVLATERAVGRPDDGTAAHGMTPRRPPVRRPRSIVAQHVQPQTSKREQALSPSFATQALNRKVTLATCYCSSHRLSTSSSKAQSSSRSAWFPQGDFVNICDFVNRCDL